jgi:hypothetical protein
MAADAIVGNNTRSAARGYRSISKGRCWEVNEQISEPAKGCIESKVA